MREHTSKIEEYDKLLESGADPALVGNHDMSKCTVKLLVYKNRILDLLDYSPGMQFVEDELEDLGFELDEIGFEGKEPDGFAVLTLKYNCVGPGTLDMDYDVSYSTVEKIDLPNPLDLV